MRWGPGLVMLLLLPSALRAQQGGTDADSAGMNATRAGRFMVRGAAGGAVLVGLAGGVFARGLCDAADCSGTGFEGLFWGALTGAVVGGIAGLVTGAALRTDGAPAPRPRRGRRWKLTAGTAWLGPGELEGWGVTLSGSTERPTVDRVSFGFETLYLGQRIVRRDEQITHPGGTFVHRERTDWHIFGVGMVARLDPQGRSTGPYLMASCGVYPLRKSLEVDRFLTNGDLPSERVADERSWTPLPGVGVGGGYAWTTGSATAAELRFRLHGILGAGDAAVLPVAEMSAGVRFQ